MKIYVAGASAELELCKRYMQKLREAGFTITHDWTAEIEKNAGKTDKDLTWAEAREHANGDLAGVAASDLFWLMVPRPPNASKGCWVELGYASSDKSKLIYVSGAARGCIFLARADQLFEGGGIDVHETAFNAIVHRYAR